MTKVFNLIKSNFEGILVASLVVSFLSEVYFFIHDDLVVTKTLGFFFIIYYSYQRPYIVESKEDRIKKLKIKGLTQQDMVNIKFVKKWEQTRKDGIWKYCIKDGGIINGVVLGFLSSGMVNWVLRKNGFQQPLSDVSSGFAFIGYCYGTGVILGIILYRVLWIMKERRFLRLTDPLNTTFTDKKESFGDLI
jgi:hypothetical protein